MANVDLSNIGHFAGYDVSTMHLVNQIEGHGIAEAGMPNILLRTIAAFALTFTSVAINAQSDEYAM